MATEWSTVLSIVEIVTYLVGAALFIAMIKADVRVVKHDLVVVQKQLTAVSGVMEQQVEVLRALAQTKVEMNYLRRDVDELRHGRGFITPSPHQE